MLTLLPALSNGTTTTSLTLAGPATTGGEPALEGLQSLRLSFEYRNQGQIAWGQWTNLALAFEGRPVDLSNLSGIRLILRTDRPRVVRVDLDSVLYEAGVEGIKFGWDLATSSAPLSIDLHFAQASMPVWARATGDQLATIRKRVESLAFHAICNDRDGGGLLPEGTTDAGFLELDAIELF